METSRWATPSPLKAKTAGGKASQSVAAPPAAHPSPPLPAAAAASIETAPVSATVAEPLPLPESTPALAVPDTTPSTFFPQPATTIPVFDIAADEYSMDEFAQTRPPDDLFSDDFEPIEEAVVEQPSTTTTVQPASPPKAPAAQRERGNRGLRRGKSHAQLRKKASAANLQPIPAPVSADGTPAPAGPKHEAVRGDRSGTGGIKKAKLTEEELSTRMEAIKLKNATLEAAHAKAEADEAHFREMEAKAAEKLKQERQNRQQMLGEREKNRLRKLNALGGREWDANKSEDQPTTEGNSHQARRGAHGGIVATDRKTEDVEPAEDPASTSTSTSTPASRGGQRGRGRGGSSRGRGEKGRGTSEKAQTIEVVPTAEDFPALNTNAAKSEQKPEVTLQPTDGFASQLKNGGSWADEMDSPVV